MQLALKHRPSTWTDVVGQEKAVSRLLQLRDGRGLGGRAYWITGASGTGKTTIARLIAQDIADDDNVEELDASALTVADLRDVERTAGIYGMGEKTGRVWVVNEAHGLRAAVVRQLLVFLEERLPSHCAIVFTTTTEGEAKLFEQDDAHPLLSRCVQIPLARRDLAKPFAARARAIAEAEGLAGDRTEAQWVRLVSDNRNNLRAVLMAVDAGEML